MGVGRGLGILVGTVVILGLGAYGPATLLGPLPAASVSTIDLDEPDAAVPPVLPATGASAVIDAAGDAPLATAGEATAVPMAAITKTITALVVLDRHPIAADGAGANVPITSADYLSYIDYSQAGTRTVSVFTADAWTEREMLQALLLGSSNNHADTLARWAYGSVDDYVAAANAWLSEQGMPDTTVVDATGLSVDSVGTAADLAVLSRLALDNPVISSVLAEPVTGLPSRRGITNTTTYLPESGVTGISRSYTDAAGICLLFAIDVEPEGATEPFRVYGAFLRQPDWAALESGVLALVDSAVAGVSPVPVIAEGTPVATVTTAWGQTAQGIAGLSADRVRWGQATPQLTVNADPVTIAGAGTTIGNILIDDGAAEPTSVTLKLGSSLHDPGVLWRLANPVPVIGALIASL
ncbi:D-alanyl-D-alanine carboxypeptidase (penicillin-binding protein 5/6) [Mycetocola sp. CAN_C7]|uniref:D-alanyl-D-alanine carboxypeptidase family protein n=1 Tax=Mycetocola sp. CAN_C7 TaxID=2787724 RepID=UPI0018CBC88A